MRLRSFACAIALACGACAQVATAPAVLAPVERLRIIALNDFHGYLEAPATGLTVTDASGRAKRVDAGGVAHLAGAIRELKRGQPHTAVVGAGDLVGASPLVSSLFNDDPTVKALADAGLEISSVGNHEFDHGRDELARLQSIARFQWLAANVIDTATGRPVLPAYAIREYGGIPVAFVGLVLRTTPAIVPPQGIRGLQFRDEAATVNALVPELRAKGVEAIVVLIHQGGRSSTPVGAEGCADFDGPILAIVRRLHPAVDLVVSGHTHEAYVCRVDGRLVTSAGSYGRLVTAIDVTLDRATRDITGAQARNVVIEPSRFAAVPAIEAEVRRLAALAAVKSERVVGTIEGEFTREPGPGGESRLGSLVADAQLAAMKECGAQIAFMNPGGLRAPLASRRPGGAVTFGELHTAQPFGNTLACMTLTGAQVLRVLESQWRSAAGDPTRLLQVAGLGYAWNGSRPLGQRVVRDSVRAGGAPLDPQGSYRVVVNSYLAEGGDGFAVFREGRDVTGGPLDVEALADYIAAGSARGRPTGERIVRVDR